MTQAIITNFQIIDALKDLGFHEVTSENRNTKSRKFSHQKMTQHVSVKLSEDTTRPTSVYPLVIAREAWSGVCPHITQVPGILPSPRPARGHSLQYDGNAGVALGFGSGQSLMDFLRALISLPDIAPAAHRARHGF